MKCSLLEQNLATPRAHAPLDRRYAERALIHHEVTYTGTEGARFTTSIGSLKDLSKTGCKILGTTLPVIGGHVTVTLYLNDGQAPLCLTDATVSWIKGHVFAVRFRSRRCGWPSRTSIALMHWRPECLPNTTMQC